MRVSPLVLAVLCCSCASSHPAQIRAQQSLPPLTASRLMQDVRHLCAPQFAGRGSYQQGARRTAEFLVTEFQALGYTIHRQPIRGPYAENVFAIKPGTDDTAIVVSAHHDHLGLVDGQVYPGADDNASGIAVLLGMARHVADSSHQHTIIFASFGAEEDGLVGSAVYIRDPIWPLAQTAAVINFDMVGRHFFEAGANQPATVGVVGLEGHAAARETAFRTAAQQDLNLVSVPARLLELFSLHDRTDDWWFRRQGIPSIHFSTSLHRDYHQVSDRVDKIVPEQLSRVAHTATSVLNTLAQQH